MHPAVGHDAHQVQLGSRIGLETRDDSQPHGVLREPLLGKELVQAHQLLVDDAAGPDVFVTDFAVAHLADGQADIKPAGRDQCHGKFRVKHVVRRLPREVNGVELVLL